MTTKQLRKQDARKLRSMALTLDKFFEAAKEIKEGGKDRFAPWTTRNVGNLISDLGSARITVGNILQGAGEEVYE